MSYAIFLSLQNIKNKSSIQGFHLGCIFHHGKEFDHPSPLLDPKIPHKTACHRVPMVKNTIQQLDLLCRRLRKLLEIPYAHEFATLCINPETDHKTHKKVSTPAILSDLTPFNF
jgi:hypothetical protein